MPRLQRIDVGNEIYHVINRSNARLPIFFKEEDYKLLETIIEEAKDKYEMRILAYCLMPNHFHLVLYPREDKDLQKFMQWLTLTHTQRWHTKNGTIGTGHLYQGRYKSFLIEKDDNHLKAVIRYVERNPLRAKLVKKTENWSFSSLNRRLYGDENQRRLLSKWPISEPKDYLSFVNSPLNSMEEDNIKQSIIKGRPYGSEIWFLKMINKFALESSLRGAGRPKKST